ncbi:hypothetical protein [Vaginella massiliensis]|uniref:hypothetical protein n=1 Tax=Vaginella massiliensis TaxID=1816680 RepID=UPI001F169A32|nr:hypothetical protein [Vaginella massiliensis]
MVHDPVVHHGMSPYNAFDNNPVYWADPSGADSQGGGDESNIGDTKMAFGVTAGQLGQVSKIEYWSASGDTSSGNGSQSGIKNENNKGNGNNVFKKVGKWIGGLFKGKHKTPSSNGISIGAAELISVEVPETTITQYDPSSASFLSKWSKNNSFLEKLSYNLINDAYVTSQVFLNIPGIELSDESNRNPFTGANYTNMDGSANYQQMKSFANTSANFVPVERSASIGKFTATGGLGFLAEKAVPHAPHFGPVLKGVYINKYTAPVLNFGINQWNNRIPTGSFIIMGTKGVGNQ